MRSTIVELRQAAIVSSLRRCRFFEGLPRAALEKVAFLTVVKSLDKGEYVFREGTPVRGFYIVQRGVIKVHRVNANGKEQVIHYFRAHESFGEETLVSNLGHPADACATEASQVLMVQKPGFVHLLRRHPELVLRLLRSMSQQLDILVALLDDLTLKDVKTRLANWLIQRCPNPDSHEPYRIELPMAKRLLAAELGTASETFSRTMAKFRAEKLLAVDGKTVTLLCPNKLTEFLRYNGVGGGAAYAAL